MSNEHGRDPLGQALALRAKPASGLAPSGFDPSRKSGFDALILSLADIDGQLDELSDGVKSLGISVDGLSDAVGKTQRSAAVLVLVMAAAILVGITLVALTLAKEEISHRARVSAIYEPKSVEWESPAAIAQGDGS